MKALQILLFMLVIYDAVSLKCYRCGRVENERCEKNINLPKTDCDEPSLEAKEKFGVRAVCVKTTRNVPTSNKTFYERMCGFNEHGNRTCTFLDLMHEDTSINFACHECEKDLCNGTRSSNVSIIALIIKTLSVLFMKLF